MERTASIDSIEALERFRAELLKFIEAARVAISEAEGDIRRTQMWLEREQSVYWQAEIRKRTEAVRMAQAALRQKKLFPTATGGRASTVDEEKALAVARRRLDEAEQKLQYVRQWRIRLEKESMQYRGMMQSVSGMVDSDLPRGVAQIDRMLQSLQRYMALSAPSRSPSEESVSIRRPLGADDEATQEDQASSVADDDEIANLGNEDRES